MNIELMIPAGNIEHFFQALNCGADSIYLGLKKFNARRTAENFNIYQLKKIINIAHEKNKKIYLALNIDLKSSELYEAAQIIELVSGLNTDGIIIKDPAIIYLINKFFKDKIKMHFSTQCAITSSYGVEFLKKINASRIVLARELNLEEIKIAASVQGIECEIFAQGSMCFSVSGQCLGSSWVGGRSGNRGLCTAPCRVMWECRDEKFTFFSMKDLSLIHELNKIKGLNIKALKIEGRLKNTLWVKAITEIYRNALDNSDDINKINELFNDLKKYTAREISTGHFYKNANLIGKNENWENYEKPQNNSIEKINLTANEISIIIENNKLNVSIIFCDKTSRLEINIPQSPKKASPIPFENIKDFLEHDIIKNNNFEINTNQIDILLSSSSIQKIASSIIEKIKSLEKEEEKLPVLERQIEDELKSISLNKKRKKILGDFPDKVILYPDQLKYFLNINYPVETVSVYLKSIPDDLIIQKLSLKYKIILSIPAVLFESNAKIIDDYIKKISKNESLEFEANSYTGLQILSEIKNVKNIGHEMPVMNHVAAKFFYEIGYSSVYCSMESDISMYKSLSAFTNGKIEAVVFAKIPFFQSRVNEDFFKCGNVYKDKFSCEIECFKENDLNIFIIKTPLNLINEKIKNENICFDSLTADLRFFKNPEKTLDLIFNNKLDIKNTSTFNFYKKLV